MDRGHPAEMYLAPDKIPSVPLGDMEQPPPARGIEEKRSCFEIQPSVPANCSEWDISCSGSRRQMPYRGVMDEGICV
jgi:hypothetical protein